MHRTTQALTPLFLTLMAAVPSFSQTPNLAFKQVSDGLYAFNTGVLGGRLHADKEAEGLAPVFESPTGVELTHGKGFPGFLSYYRIFSKGTRYGESARSAPKTSRLLEDGGVEITWHAREECPVDLTATYHCSATDTIDLDTQATPRIDMPGFEVFLSSYFNEHMVCEIYAKPGLHVPSKPAFVAANWNQLVNGTYLAFPRDLTAVHTLFDGRWEIGPNPIQFSVIRFFQAPLAVRLDLASDMGIALMARPQDCFAVSSSYNQEFADEVGGHRSTYFSLFGEDVKAGETKKAVCRLVFGRGLKEPQALDHYKKFLKEHP